MPESLSWLYNFNKSTKRLKIASVTLQCDPEPAVNRTKMVETILAMKRDHSDVELVVFGEMVLCWYAFGKRDYIRGLAESIPGETTRIMADVAVEQNIFICFGLLESGKGGQLYNAQVLINPQGNIQTIHRKWNLKPGERQANIQPGPFPVTLTDIMGVRTGIVICSDAASPRAMWELIKSRLELIILSLADDRDEELFMAKFNARMYDAWIITANRYGDEDGCYWNGHTVISDPLGSLRASLQDKPGYLVHELCIDTHHPVMKRMLRNLAVKLPLAFHILRNWKKIREYR